ncbi:Aldo/keto reductase [Lactarius akahatsu]|uniref:Aldo/keto reductase n=1 Tax=Lactarius akahatsu TaxID=416441 RepID=A0AAD4LRF7_9AGAM|nr:Aldo/keto reductase [Lactarius akahatsu]
MPWDAIQLNDGNVIPGIAFGTGGIGNGQGPIDQVDQAISVGFSHIGKHDTAQIYRNEEEAGIAVRESGLARQDIFITTKYSGLNGLDIETSIQNSLKNLGVEYVDLYLIHFPSLAQPDIPTAWAKMEAIKKAGLAKPACSVLIGLNSPITHQPGGPVDKPLNEIAQRLGATTDQVLLAWVRAKGAVAVTTSSKKFRLEGYLAAGDLKISAADIEAIDSAGAKGARQGIFVKSVRAIAELMLFGAVAFRIYTFFA